MLYLYYMMMTLIVVGKIKQQWVKDGVDDYLKRLTRYTRVTITEVPDQRIAETFSLREREKALNREAEGIHRAWPAAAWSAALTSEGDPVGSQELADLVSQCVTGGRSHLLFVAGGSEGLSPSVTERCDRRLSFGKPTYPHQLFRVMLLEQLYRVMKIRSGQTYHK